LRVELDEHLDEERAEALPEGANPLPNRRNGSSPKTVATDSGKVLPGIPRDRNGSFDPIPIAKDRRRLPEVDPRIVGLCAHGMTDHESKGQIEAICGIGADPSARPWLHRCAEFTALHRPSVAADTCKRRAASRPAKPIQRSVVQNGLALPLATVQA